MESKAVGCLIVVDDHLRPKGLITDRDVVLRGLERGRNPDETNVGEIMSKVSAKVREGTSVNTAIVRMGADGVRRLPVVDSHGRLAGVFTYDDALLLVAGNLSLAAEVIRAQLPPGAGESTLESTWEVPTARRYHQEPLALGPDATVYDAIDGMEEAGTGSLVVVDSERAPIGIVTDRDVMCRVVAVGADPEHTRLESIMSKDVAFSREDASLTHVLEYAQSRSVRRIPLVDDRGRLTAIVSLDDVMAELNSEFAHLSAAVRTELRPYHRRSLELR
jgi:CBS domain-containing protein